MFDAWPHESPTAPLSNDETTLSPRENMTDYVVLVAAGLEHIAMPAIAARLKTNVCRVLHPSASEQWSRPPPKPADLLFPGDAGTAKLHFALPTPRNVSEWAAQHAAIAALPCTQAVLAPLALASGLRLDNGGLQQIEALARSLPEEKWDAAMRTWRHCRHDGVPCAAQPRFRASSIRDGKHTFDSPMVAEAVGAAIYESRGVPVHLWEYELEVVCVVLQGHVLLALNLWHGSRKFFRARLGPEPRPLLPYSDTPASLRPSTAWLLLQLAEVRRDDVVLDPMCGIGTLPLVAAATECAVALAGDIDEALLTQAAGNAAWLREARRRGAGGDSGCLQLQISSSSGPQMDSWHATERLFRAGASNSGVLPIAWDATCIALRPGCVDVIVVDFPFGAVHKVKGGKSGLRALYAQSIREMARVLRPGGRLVALATSRRGVEEPLEMPDGLWGDVTALQVNNGGTLAWVVKAVRTSVPGRAPASRRPFAAKPVRLASRPAVRVAESSCDSGNATIAADASIERKGRGSARAQRRAQRKSQGLLWPLDWRRAAGIGLFLIVAGAAAAARARRQRAP